VTASSSLQNALPRFITDRRSVRAFSQKAVPETLLDTCVSAACLAPAPHHSRPWRWVTLGKKGRSDLAQGMAASWRQDLTADAVEAKEIDRLCHASISRITAAPAAVLGCLVREGLDTYPDNRRQQAEWNMALLSLGAGVENLLLTATAHGLSGCWIAAPVFCPDAARQALHLDAALTPQALILLGYPHHAYTLPERPPIPLALYRLQR